ncbi:Integrin-Linked Protein Kinase [Manis pentadactyla]|nr:Integrin-Linked Protein Kinase [Manis pentadactyla]
MAIRTRPKPSSPELSPVVCCLLLTCALHTPGHRPALDPVIRLGELNDPAFHRCCSLSQITLPRASS